MLALEALSTRYGPLPKDFHFREVDQDAWVHAYRVSELPPFLTFRKDVDTRTVAVYGICRL